MKKQLLVCAIGLALTATALAQGTTGQTTVSTSSIANSWNALKESPLSLSFYSESDTVRDSKTYEINGITQANIAYLGYKFSDNDSMTIENRHTLTKRQEQDAVNAYERINVGYSRKNLLTEAKHGVALKATVDARYRPQGTIRQKSNSYGQGRVSAGLSKNMGPISLAASSYYARPMRIKKDEDKTTSTWQHTLTQGYNITDTLNVSLVEDIFIVNNPSNQGEARSADLYVDVSNAFTADFTLGAFVSGTPVSTEDRWVTDNQWLKSRNLTYAAYLSLTVF